MVERRQSPSKHGEPCTGSHADELSDARSRSERSAGRQGHARKMILLGMLPDLVQAAKVIMANPPLLLPNRRERLWQVRHWLADRQLLPARALVMLRGAP